MKDIKEIAELAKVSTTVIYKRIKRIDETRPDDYYPIYRKTGGQPRRYFPEDEATEIINGALPEGRQKKVYSED